MLWVEEEQGPWDLSEGGQLGSLGPFIYKIC